MDPAGILLVDLEHLADAAVRTIDLQRAGILKLETVLVNPFVRGINVWIALLRDDPNRDVPVGEETAEDPVLVDHGDRADVCTGHGLCRVRHGRCSPRGSVARSSSHHAPTRQLSWSPWACLSLSRYFAPTRRVGRQGPLKQPLSRCVARAGGAG